MSDAYWADLSEVYERRTQASKTAHDRLRERIPGGVASSTREIDPHPIVIDHADGVYLEDVDGNRYLDFDMNNGAGICGHTNRAVTDALRDQLDRGTLYTMPHELLSEAATALTDRWEAIEKVRFTNSGTESTMHAIRTARSYSGRDKIVKVEGAYHGTHDYVMVSYGPSPSKMGHPKRPAKVSESAGIPDAAVETVEVVPFNDLEAVAATFEEHCNEIGALIVEPVLLNKAVTLPRNEFLQGLRDLCGEYGVVLIFDEVKTGVKIAPGGAAEYYGVEPDLVTLGKSVGGETPVGAFGGKAGIMDEIEGDAPHYGTYNGNPLVIRALVTTLREVLTEEAYDHLARLGDRLATGYERVMSEAGLSGHVEHIGSQGMIMFTGERIGNYRDFVENIDDEFHRLFWFGMVNRGVIPHPYGARQQWTLSVQHTEAHIDKAIECFEQIAPELADVQESA